MRAVTRLGLISLATCLAAGAAHAQGKASNKAAGPPPAATAPFTVEMLMKASPRAKREIAEAFITQWPAINAAGINTPQRIHHFLAQLMVESGGLRIMEENLNYSAKRLRQIFPKYVRSDDQAASLAGQPAKIANLVYGNRLGNVCETDGWDFRGSGLIQLTGRANFRARDAALKLNPKLEDYPQLARSVPTAIHVAVSYWTSRAINASADANNLTAVRKKVNGGAIGLNEAGIWLAQVRKAVRLPEDKSVEEKGFGDPTSREQMAVEDQLVALGFLQPQEKSATSNKSAGDKAETVANSLRQFQASRDIPQTGQFDEATLYELTDPGNYLEKLIVGPEGSGALKGQLPSFCRT